jgi:hypothetical protein
MNVEGEVQNEAILACFVGSRIETNLDGQDKTKNT